ncbi:MAG: glycoside hydrolase family 32 protein [Anaerolineae bacterium]
MELRHRPQYHFLPVANWMNDPNGLIQWKGVYHLFYQHNPAGAAWGDIHWGHAASRDLVHWTHLPIALAPGPQGPDKDGVWSGCAVNHDGVPTLVYTGVSPQVQCLATSDDEMILWNKSSANPIIAAPPEGLDATGFRDPYVWREDDKWYMVIGSGARNVGGMILLYCSPDLYRWEYLGPLFEGRLSETGHNWECPNYVSLHGHRLLIFSPEPFLQAHYYLGQQHGTRFEPYCHGLLDHGGLYYAPQAFLDEAGRCICFGWLREGRASQAAVAAGWAGVQSLPRVFSVGADGDLRQRPVEAMEQLRGAPWSPAPGPLLGKRWLSMSGTALEISLEIAPGEDSHIGLELMASPEGEERTLLAYDAAKAMLTLDSRQASLHPLFEGRLSEAPLQLEEGLLRLQVYLDHSVIEVFANERVVLTARVYPTRTDATGLALWAEGAPATIASLRVWPMASIWSSRH